MDGNAGYVYAGYVLTAVVVAAYALRLAFGLRRAERRDPGGSGAGSGGAGPDVADGVDG